MGFGYLLLFNMKINRYIKINKLSFLKPFMNELGLTFN